LSKAASTISMGENKRVEDIGMQWMLQVEER
jgi:hypothetical protein